MTQAAATAGLESTSPPRRRMAAADRRAQLLSAAISTIRSQGADASMSEIARTAGVTKPILYEHFGDKSGLAEALSDRFLGELGDSLEAILTLDADPRTAISDGIAMFAAFAEREPELYRFLVEGSPGGSRESFDSPMLEGLADVVARFLVGSSPNQSAAARSELWAVSVLGTVFSGVGWWLQRGGRSRDDLVADLTDLVWGGISGAA